MASGMDTDRQTHIHMHIPMREQKNDFKKPGTQLKAARTRFKKQPNDNLITLTCVAALVYIF